MADWSTSFDMAGYSIQLSLRRMPGEPGWSCLAWTEFWKLHFHPTNPTFTSGMNPGIICSALSGRSSDERAAPKLSH